MIFHFPYIRMPYYRYSHYGYQYPNYIHSNYYNNYSNISSKKNNVKKDTLSNECDLNNNSKTKDFRTNQEKQKNKTYNTCDNNKDTKTDIPIFQLFGINLYFDDILIIGLIWFLYNEGVKDEELFISLILLLLS